MVWDDAAGGRLLHGAHSPTAAREVEAKHLERARLRLQLLLRVRARLLRLAEALYLHLQGLCVRGKLVVQLGLGLVDLRTQRGLPHLGLQPLHVCVLRRRPLHSLRCSLHLQRLQLHVLAPQRPNLFHAATMRVVRCLQAQPLLGGRRPQMTVQPLDEEWPAQLHTCSACRSVSFSRFMCSSPSCITRRTSSANER
jgi:hypothetical protein